MKRFVTLDCFLLRATESIMLLSVLSGASKCARPVPSTASRRQWIVVKADASSPAVGSASSSLESSSPPRASAAVMSAAMPVSLTLASACTWSPALTKSSPVIPSGTASGKEDDLRSSSSKVLCVGSRQLLLTNYPPPFDEAHFTEAVGHSFVLHIALGIVDHLDGTQKVHHELGCHSKIDTETLKQMPLVPNFGCLDNSLVLQLHFGHCVWRKKFHCDVLELAHGVMCRTVIQKYTDPHA